ncbi:MAG TPA: response regulator, partial [Pirellulales bacterium]|nr:response regulator [Pirellulales bacterium]
SLPDSQGLDSLVTLVNLHPSLAVVVLTGCDDVASGEAAVAAGAEDYLVKGAFDRTELERRLRFAIGRRRCAPAPPARQGPAAADGNSAPTGQLVEAHHAPEHGRAMRLLQVEDNSSDASLLRESLEEIAGTRFEWVHVERFADALTQLASADFDAVLLDLSLPDSRGLESCRQLRDQAPDVPVVVLTGTPDDSLGLRAIQLGAQDFLVKGRIDPQRLTRAVQFAVRRHWRDQGLSATIETRITLTEEVGAELNSFAPRGERYPLAKSVLAIPVLADGRPDWEGRLDGITCNIGSDGLALELACDGPLGAMWLLIGIERADGTFDYSPLEVKHVATLGAGRVVVGGLFAGWARRLLDERSLTPVVDPRTMRYTLGLPDDLLAHWAEVGVLTPVLFDKVQVCPRCHAVASFRRGCRACGCVRTAQDRLIHHFACAEVGFARDFEQDGELVCPKCRARRLVVGADFEYQKGPHRCHDCGWSGTELEHVGQCLACDFRFAERDAHEQELIGYDVHRLDPLALLAAP